MSSTPVDSPVDWVAEHIREYVESAGENGHIWVRGAPTLLLTTVGRRSGTPRRTALIYGRDGENYLVVASHGGSPAHPAWYLNLEANPEVEIQVGAEKFTAHARTASTDERARLWPDMTKIWPDFDNYQTGTDREIPIVVLEPQR